MKDLTVLIDMDNTLCDFEGQLKKDIFQLSNHPPSTEINYRLSSCPQDIQKKSKIIMSSPGWWQNLPTLKDGLELYKLAKEGGAYIEILTKAPKTYPLAWTEKFLWCKKNIPDVDNINLTLQKKKYPGDILIDDWPDYITSWLDYNQNSKAILPLREWNKDYTHPRAIHYNGKNTEQVIQLIKDIREHNTHL